MHLSPFRVAVGAIFVVGLVVAVSGFTSFDLVAVAFGAVMIVMGLALEFANRRNEKLKISSEALRSTRKESATCKSCGAKIQVNSQYCSKCKAPLKQIA
jgi:hypothetical protein